VLATYTPHGWNGLTVRAAWGPSTTGDGVDLEVQASASTVGELRKLEILVRSAWGEAPTTSTTAEPRDRASAALSYDGREPDELLEQLTTFWVPAAGSSPYYPLIVPIGGSSGYLEMIQPNDASRRLVERDGQDSSIVTSARYALFGVDLEKGVVLRGRLRGTLLEPGDDADEHVRRFLQEPPPLGT
jgi:hypothetical protein